jgi:uncharacterized damage-inducible protein DinB
MTASEARLHLRYSTWASRKLLDAAAKLNPDDLKRTTGVSHTSILGTLAHIQFADWIWYTRLVEPMEKPGGTLETLQSAWPALHEKWEAWADKLKDPDLDRVAEYKMMDGTPFHTPVWKCVLHVVNHATLHRGQVMAMIRQLGQEPPHTDLIYYYREMDAAQAGAA